MPNCAGCCRNAARGERRAAPLRDAARGGIIRAEILHYASATTRHHAVASAFSVMLSAAKHLGAISRVVVTSGAPGIIHAEILRYAQDDKLVDTLEKCHDGILDSHD